MITFNSLLKTYWHQKNISGYVKGFEQAVLEQTQTVLS